MNTHTHACMHTCTHACKSLLQGFFLLKSLLQGFYVKQNAHSESVHSRECTLKRVHNPRVSNLLSEHSETANFRQCVLSDFTLAFTASSAPFRAQKNLGNNDLQCVSRLQKCLSRVRRMHKLRRVRRVNSSPSFFRSLSPSPLHSPFSGERMERQDRGIERESASDRASKSE